MSRRGRSKGSPISLFSFQDIITSVTAIMILLVLILTLEFISRTKYAGVANDHKLVAKQLIRSIKTLEHRLADLKTVTADAQKAARRVASFSAAEIAQQNSAAIEKARRLERDLKQIKSTAKIAHMEQLSAESNLLECPIDPAEALQYSTAAEKANRQADRTESANQLEKQKLDDAEKQIRDHRPRAAAIVFNAPPGSAKEPVLIEVSKDGVAAIDASSEKARAFGWGILGPPTSFEKWLVQRNAQKEYIVIILRPSGVDRYGAVREAVLAANLEVGTELIGEAMAVLLRNESAADH